MLGGSTQAEGPCTELKAASRPPSTRRQDFFPVVCIYKRKFWGVTFQEVRVNFVASLKAVVQNKIPFVNK